MKPGAGGSSIQLQEIWLEMLLSQEGSNFIQALELHRSLGIFETYAVESWAAYDKRSFYCPDVDISLSDGPCDIQK